jgi:ABC-2 type transport system ATP-binding protein
MTLIEVNNLKKEYRINQKKEGLRGAFLNLFNPKYINKTAVDNISFSIDQGELIGYIGANGAGKSTTIKMLTGILKPTSGNIKVNNADPFKNRTKNNMQIGAVFGQRSQLWWDLPVIESYKLIQKIYEIPPLDYKQNLEMFIELLGLEPLLKIPVRQLSLGQKMRCEIAAAFIYDPKIVYLDEPTIGLDVLVKDKIRQFIKMINKEKNTTVILTTHDLQDIEEVCKRVIIIDQGSIIFDGGIDTIKEKFGNRRSMQVTVSAPNNLLKNVLDENQDVLTSMVEDNIIHVDFDGQKITAAAIMSLISNYTEVIDLTIQETSIETIVKDLYRK